MIEELCQECGNIATCHLHSESEVLGPFCDGCCDDVAYRISGFRKELIEETKK